MNPIESIFRLFGTHLRRKSMENVELNQLLDFLGVKYVKGEALSEATYFACLKVLSESIGKLPLKIQQHIPNKGVRIAREHPWYRALNERPNRYMSASIFWSGMEQCRNHYGNAYALIDWSNDPKRPRQLWPMDPKNVRIWYDNACLLREVPDVYYQYSTPKGQIVLGSEDVLHFKSHHTMGGLAGISVREQLSSTIQGNIKAQKMVSDMYDSGMTAKAVLQYTGGLNPENVDALTKQVELYAQGKKRSGGVANIIPIPVGFTLTPLNMKLADSQFLEVKQYSALQIASAFGVKPYQVGDYTKSSYASAEAQQLSFLIDTLLFNVKQYEEEIAYKLLTSMEESDGYHVKFNTGVILRADQQTQINTLSAAVSNFLMTPNEAREKLDLPWVQGGDQLLGNGASIPVQYAGLQYTNTTTSAQGKEGEKWMLKK
ncbi:MAG: phage portal protein [Oscillospiraceae bacterium]|nr:phage portal protein [Oscillospiraceae bacterium]